MTSSRVTNDYGGLALPKKRQQTRFPLGGESKSVIVYVYDSDEDKNTAITYPRVNTERGGSIFTQKNNLCGSAPT